MIAMFLSFMVLETAACSQYFVEYNYPECSQAWFNPSSHFQQESDQSWSQPTDSQPYAHLFSQSTWGIPGHSMEDFSQFLFPSINPSIISNPTPSISNWEEYSPSLMSFELTNDYKRQEEIEEGGINNMHENTHSCVMFSECDQTTSASCAEKSFPKTHFPNILCVDGVFSSFDLEPSSQYDNIHQREMKSPDTLSEFEQSHPERPSSTLLTNLATDNVPPDVDSASPKPSVSTRKSRKRRMKTVNRGDPLVNSDSSCSFDVSSQLNSAESQTTRQNLQTDTIESEMEKTQLHIEMLERGTSIKMRKLRRFVEDLEKLDRDDKKFPYFSLKDINKGIEKTREELVELEVLKKHAEKLMKLQSRGFSLKQNYMKIKGIEKNLAYMKNTIGKTLQDPKKESRALMKIERLEKYRDELKEDLEILMELEK